MEGFADALCAHVSGKETLREIPKGQRLIGRASLKRQVGERECDTGSIDSTGDQAARAQSNGGRASSEITLLDSEPTHQKLHRTG